VWLLFYFEKACEHLKRDQSYKVWQDGCHAEIVETYFSPARNYACLENDLDVVVLDLF